MKRTKLYMVIVILILISMISVGCSNSSSSLENMALKVGLMPAVDAAPILLAEEKGYFEELGLDVEIEIFTNAQNRQSALQTNSIDGAMTDLIAVATNVDGGFDIKATTMTNGMFPVLMTKGSEDKESIKVGMMEVSVTNFLIDQWLGDKYKIEKVFINDIPTRLAAIVSGDLDMGLFPEPFASMGALQGLEKKTFNYADEYCPDVFVFTGKALKEKEEAIKRFHEAYNRAVDDIQKNELEARNIIIEKIPNLKPEIKDDIILPEYTRAKLQDTEYINMVIKWTEETLNRDLNIEAEDLVERKFVEK